MLKSMLKSFLNELQFGLILTPLEILFWGQVKTPSFSWIQLQETSWSYGSAPQLLPRPMSPLTFSTRLLEITILCYILCNSSIHPSLTRFDLIPPYCLFTVSILFQLKLRTYDWVSYSNTKLSSFQKVYAQILAECREKKFFMYYKNYLEGCASNICIGNEDTGRKL